MKLTWIKWNALAAAVLMAGSVAMAQDKGKPAPTPPQEWTPTTAPTPAEKPKPTPPERKDKTPPPAKPQS